MTIIPQVGNEAPDIDSKQLAAGIAQLMTGKLVHWCGAQHPLRKRKGWKVENLDGLIPFWFAKYVQSFRRLFWVAESCCYLIFMEVYQRWMTGRVICPHFSHLDSDVAGLLHWHTSGVNCGFVSSLQGRQGGEGFGQWWSNLLRIRITKELFEWNMLDWKKIKSRESLGLWESGFLLVFEHFVGVCCCHHDLFGVFVSPPTKNVTRLRSLVILMSRLLTNGRPTSRESNINQLAGSRG